MMKAATQRKFDLVMCWSIDRLGRSLQNLVEILNELQSLKVDLMFLQQGLDTSSASGRMMFSVFGALAEFLVLQELNAVNDCSEQFVISIHTPTITERRFK
jgi:DNA invertase Pin-like site-specific DNA recombinase